MGKNQPIFGSDSEDRCRGFKFFLTNFRDFCIMEYFVNPAKEIDSPKAMAALQRVFPQSSIIGCPDHNHRWLAKFSSHYLREEPVILAYLLKPYSLWNIGPQEHSSNALSSVRSSSAMPISFRWPSPLCQYS